MKYEHKILQNNNYLDTTCTQYTQYKCILFLTRVESYLGWIRIIDGECGNER